MKRLSVVLLIVLLSMTMMPQETEAGCGRRCRKSGSRGGHRYVSRMTHIRYCLCSGPNRFMPRK